MPDISVLCNMSLQPILDDIGIPVTRYEQVHGGDINRSWCLYTNNGKFFLKVNDAALYPGMFEKEANGLEALRNYSSFKIPVVHRVGQSSGQQYLLLEFIEKGSVQPGYWQRFGKALAQLHHQPQTSFGWKEDNYIGSLQQSNTQHLNWSSFYTECRIRPLIKKLFSMKALSSSDVSGSESLCRQLGSIFPDEPASLLHGDLWSGNYMITAIDGIAIYDPAVYCGHREMDIGMSLLFGGFAESFYTAYNESYPLEKNWQQRIPLTQLYPLLVHAVLFGGHYVNDVREIILQYK
jgi:fructosamine-3-kinase